MGRLSLLKVGGPEWGRLICTMEQFEPLLQRVWSHFIGIVQKDLIISSFASLNLFPNDIGRNSSRGCGRCIAFAASRGERGMRACTRKRIRASHR
jgi:hypothetical protein